MLTCRDIIVKKEHIASFKKGYPLISQESIVSWSGVDEGTLLTLKDEKGNFLATGYHGKQNKGFGWIFSLNKNEKIDEKFFIDKIKSAIEYRKEFIDSTDTTAFRLFNGEGDGAGGISIDCYNDVYIITWYSIGIYRYAKYIISAMKATLPYRAIYQKKRFDTKGMYLDDSKDYVAGEIIKEPIIVKESGESFAIHVDDGAMVGVFLDQRDVRKNIRDNYAKGKTLLNTFSYTGAFSIFGVLGGATKTTSVDLAKRSRAKTIEQFSVNNIDASTQNIVVDDVFNYFKYALRKGLSYDIVVLDPPSFARSKKRTFSASKDYVNLLKEAIEITNRGGTIVASTNSANFSMMTFRDFIFKAFKELKGKYKVQESFTLPKDFRVHKEFKEGNYLKVVFITKVS